MDTSARKIRIDKWLWAARVDKTRNLPNQAIEGGKVHCDGQRVKASKEISTGIYLTIRQNMDEKTVLVTALSEQRRGAPEAALLYQETDESREQRERLAAERKAGMASYVISDHRPNKKERRQIFRFERLHQDD